MSVFPVFLVTQGPGISATQCTFWCNFCKTRHMHGVLSSQDVETRTPHCWKSASPLKDVSYGITTNPDAVNAAMLELWEEILLLRHRIEVTKGGCGEDRHA